nr:accessory movement protein [Cocksfoot mild mosaic virus]
MEAPRIPLTVGDVAKHHKSGPIDLLEVGPSSVLNHWPMASLWARHPPEQWLIDKAGRSIPSRKSYFKSLPRQPMPTRPYRSYPSSSSTPWETLDMEDELSIWPVSVSYTLSMSGSGCGSRGSQAVPQLLREMWF